MEFKEFIMQNYSDKAHLLTSNTIYPIDENILKLIELSIDDVDIEDLDLLVDEELKYQSAIKNQLTLYNKEDIMNMFKCESDKALKILRLAFQMKYSFKLGKEFYITQEDFNKFLDDIKGRNTIL